MKELDLGRILKQMYHQGRKRQESLIMLYLFGIKYGRFIMEQKLSVRYILCYADLPDSYKIEIERGIILSKYVVAI